MRYNISLLVAGLFAASPAYAIGLKSETKAETKTESKSEEFQTPEYVSPEGHAHFVPSDFDYEVQHWSHEDQIFNQAQYEETVASTAEIMVALEAMKNELEKITLQLADIEVEVYGNSNDSYDNFGDIDANQLDVGQNRSTYAGLVHRVHDLADKCRWNQSELYYNRDVLLLYCQQFAFAPEMVPACAPLLSCQERQLNYSYGFDGQHYHAPEIHVHHNPEPEPYGVTDYYKVNVHAG